MPRGPHSGPVTVASGTLSVQKAVGGESIPETGPGTCRRPGRGPGRPVRWRRASAPLDQRKVPALTSAKILDIAATMAGSRSWSRVVVGVPPDVERDPGGAEVGEALAHLAPQLELGRPLLLVRGRPQVLVGLDHEPHGPARGHPRDDGLRAREPLGGAGEVDRVGAVRRLDRVPVEHDDVGHARGVRVAAGAEAGHVPEQGDDRMLGIGRSEGPEHRPDLGRADPGPGGLLDGDVAEGGRVVLHLVDPLGDPRRVDRSRPVVDRLGEGEDHLQTAGLGLLEVVGGVEGPGGVLDHVGRARRADAVRVLLEVPDRDLLDDHRGRRGDGGLGRGALPVEAARNVPTSRSVGASRRFKRDRVTAHSTGELGVASCG